MKNYDKIMNEMTPERLAEVNVKLVTVNSTNLFYMTSSGQLFPTSQFPQAVAYEYNWLMTDPNPEETGMPDPASDEQECACECGEPDRNCKCESDEQRSTDEVAN